MQIAGSHVQSAGSVYLRRSLFTELTHQSEAGTTQSSGQLLSLANPATMSGEDEANQSDDDDYVQPQLCGAPVGASQE
jgi:hypothetical protein